MPVLCRIFTGICEIIVASDVWMTNDNSPNMGGTFISGVLNCCSLREPARLMAASLRGENDGVRKAGVKQGSSPCAASIMTQTRSETRKRRHFVAPVTANQPVRKTSFLKFPRRPEI